MEHKKTMMLITSYFGEKHEYKTFRLIPTSEDCPFNEALYDPTQQGLAIISKTPKTEYHMFTKVDDSGFPMDMKNGKKHRDGSTYKKERRQIETFYEYFIKDKGEIKTFVELHAVNSEFDIIPFFDIDRMMAPSVAPIGPEENPEQGN